MSDHIDPIAMFADWFDEAERLEPNDPNAMALATVDADGRPSLRMVLLKAHGPDGFVFYTNLASRKALALAACPNAALLFHWKSLRRQVRIEGPVSYTSAEEANAYFASRGRLSQIGAYASRQSAPLASEEALKRRVADVEARFDGQPVPRPAHWSGYRVSPLTIEFWTDQPSRLHERRLFTAQAGSWTESRLFP